GRNYNTLLLALLGALTACSVPDEAEITPHQGVSGTDGGQGDGVAPCAYGQITCDGSIAKTCDGHGGIANEEDWSSDAGSSGGASLPRFCHEGLGCVVCEPMTGTCEANLATLCDATGQTSTQFACDEVQGMVCAPDGCKGACSPRELGTSTVGCDY